jgi:hypothetical protein
MLSRKSAKRAFPVNDCDCWPSRVRKPTLGCNMTKANVVPSKHLDLFGKSCSSQRVLKLSVVPLLSRKSAETPLPNLNVCDSSQIWREIDHYSWL